ncbi:MAG: hypothetical protein ACI8P3_003857 [Saprospiraceae bacterium]|jgi:hypothetical protein
MKYLNIVLLFFVFSLTVAAQSTLKGVLQRDFAALENDTNYIQTAKKWNLYDQPIFDPDDCNKSGVIDLCFLVDATSSMDDQIGFLKAEIQKTIETVQDFNNIRFRTSAVFYRDLEEEYKIKSAPFTNELDKTIQFISDQNSAGGGDYPEAFADGFSEAVNLDWNEKADAKLLFIFCDAPPHNDTESLNLFQNALKIAASKGISLFPVLGTAADFDTEVIMKSLASQRNGALISLQQQEASKNSNADFLVDLMQDLMKEYTNLKDCDPSSTSLEKGFVYGNINDAFSREPLIAANITVTQNGNFITGAVADMDGFYTLDVEPGTYDFEFSFIGFQKEVKKGIEVIGDEEQALNTQLKAGINLEPVIITAYQMDCFQEYYYCVCHQFISNDCVQKNKVLDSKINSDNIEIFKNSTNIFPNPASNVVTVSATEDYHSIKILSADGKLIFQQNNINENQLEVQVGDWVAGMYFVYYYFEGRTELEKLIVSKK